MYRSAVISADGLYRYNLERYWEAEIETRRLLFLMLNPSTADALKDDPTTEVCITFAKNLGFGQVELVNFYAWRATEPKDMWVERAMGTDVVGPLNATAIAYAARRADMVIGGWGAANECESRVEEVLRLVRKDVYALHVTKDGAPGHPLYLKRSLQPKLWRAV